MPGQKHILLRCVRKNVKPAMAEANKDTSVLDWEIYLDEEVRFVESVGDPKLKVLYWTRNGAQVPAGPGRRIVFYHPGIGEHSRRYKHVASQVLARVPAVEAFATYDMRCHGGSEGGRGKIADISDIESDVRGRVFPALAERFGSNMRMLLMGHSLGGLIIASVASTVDPFQKDELGKIEGVFLSAPAIEPVIPGVINRMLLPFVHVLAAVPFMKTVCKSSGIAGNSISHDSKVVKLYDGGDDQLVSQTSIGLASSLLTKANAVVTAIQRNEDCCLRSEIPVMCAHGEDDPLVLASGSKKLVDAISRNVELVIIPKAFHEMHCESKEYGRDLFFDKLGEFVKKVFA